jgi:membrane protease YdiL (CAAX protease family)
MKTLTNGGIFDIGKEWESDRRFYAQFMLVPLVLLLVVLWIYQNVSSETKTAGIYSFILIISIIIGLIRYLIKNNDLIGFAFVGKQQPFIVSLLVGAVVSIILVGGSFAISAPTFALAASGVFWLFIYDVLVAPIAEEMFFRVFLFFTLTKIFEKFSVGNAGMYSFVLTSLLFGFFHYAVYNANASAMFSAVVFSAIAIVGNKLFGSFGFGLGMHSANNYLSYVLKA